MSPILDLKSDPLKLKILVGVVWCIEFIHQTLVAHTVYHYLVLCFGSPIIILTEPLVWSFVTLIVVGTVSESIVKFCFIIRIWRFSNHNKMVTTALSMLVFAEIDRNYRMLLAWRVLSMWHPEDWLQDIKSVMTSTLGVLTLILYAETGELVRNVNVNPVETYNDISIGAIEGQCPTENKKCRRSSLYGL
ncbi:hypothetical protein C8R41DRAFT_863721 [Lentinula lateritia]|uniref:Uncharacterized protein n=1 Tax=Lentinula lateritia TaxID=40482 RepID=A0ABQ8VTN1_9AGAR|nr:hypothetical protein C8R41DRAFT_863721 [Lentinula lateritia]